MKGSLRQVIYVLILGATLALSACTNVQGDNVLDSLVYSESCEVDVNGNNIPDRFYLSWSDGSRDTVLSLSRIKPFNDIFHTHGS